MSEDKIRAYLKDKIKRELVTGKRTGTPLVPTDAIVDRYVNQILAESRNGIIGKLDTLGKKDISDPDMYGDNFKDIKDNIEYLMGDVTSEINRIIDQINNSTVEKNNSIRELRKISTSFSEIEAGRLTSDGLSYTISDVFNDAEKVDMERTTTEFNPKATSMTLAHNKADQLQFPHYRSQNAITFTITDGFGKVDEQQQVPGTAFGGIFTTDESDRWEYTVLTSEPTKVTGYMTLKLSEIGQPVEINEINVTFSSNHSASMSDIGGMLKVEFLNIDKDEQGWQTIPGAVADMTSPEVNFRFVIPPTTHIRLLFTKNWPDDSTTNKYTFGMTELVVKKSETVYESVMVTNSMPIQSYRREQPSIHSAILSVDQKKTPGTNIKYYVAIDEPVAGKIQDQYGNRVSITSDDATAFVANGVDSNNYAENYYVYASELRDRQWITGASPYKDWEPKWQEICPINDKTTNTPVIRFFNVSAANHRTHDIYFENPLVWGDASYTGPWPAASYTGNWADNWAGDSQEAVQSGYIWGENPFTVAGVWWGGSVESPGWWRPHIPTASGTQSWTNAAKFSSPDYSLPIYDTDGRPTFYYDTNLKRNVPIQKHFWKVFKWPVGFLPIPGTVKLFSEGDSVTSSTDTTTNRQMWKWNYKSKEGVQETSVTFGLQAGTSHYTIRLEDLVKDTSEVRLIKDSVKNLRFKNYEPSVIDDFSVDYGYDYINNDETGLVERKAAEKAVSDAHATISFPEAIASYRNITSDETPEISFEVSYVAREAADASWDSYTYVPFETPVGTTFGHVYDHDNSVKRITIDSLDEYGVIISTKEIPPGGSSEGTFDKFPVPLGWSKIRVFVKVDFTQTGITDSTIAKWGPNDNIITKKDGLKMLGLNDDKNDKNRITTAGVEFAASGIVESVPITIYAQTSETVDTVDEFETVITRVENDTIDVEHETPFGIHSWEIPNFDSKKGFSHENIRMSSAQTSMKEVDMYTLMNETTAENDDRFAILEDVDNSKYLVVKTPNEDTFPEGIVNKTHITRNYIDAGSNSYVSFTTGSSGNATNGPVPIIDANVDVDDGITVTPDLSDRPSNTTSDLRYDNVSTYGQKLQINNMGGSGFLFWDTAENLQSFYRIEYSVPTNNRPCDRIFFMARLLSDTPDTTPVLNGYNLIMNSKEDLRRTL